MSRPRDPRKTQRKWILGGCRKCRRQAENHARGLCGRCESVERKAGRIKRWPKIGPESLSAERPKAPELPLRAGLPQPPPPVPDDQAPLPVTLHLPPEGMALWAEFEARARQEWRTPELQLCKLITEHLGRFPRPRGAETEAA